MLQNDGWGACAVGMGQGTAAQVMVLALQITVMGGDKATNTSDAFQANAHISTAADNSPPSKQKEHLLVQENDPPLRHTRS